MTVTGDILRGHIDMVILASLAGEDSYGYRINRDIQKAAGEKYELKEATLYSAFRRLEKERLIESYWGDEALGARRRYYKITPEGTAAYTEMLLSWEEIKKIIDAIISGEVGGD